MTKAQEEQLKEEIARIFQSGPNEKRVFDMIKSTTDRIEIEHNKKMLKKDKPSIEMAFPSEMPRIDNPNFVSHEGMTLRDYFASKAIAGFTSATDQEGNWMACSVPVEIAELCYEIADSMMKERSKRKE